MSELLFGNTVTLAVTGTALALVALVVWIKGGFQVALYSAASLIVLTVLLVMLSQWIKTDKEQVTNVLNEVASAVERNDLDAVLMHVHPNASAGINRARGELPNYRFTEARITGIKNMEVDPKSNPPSAIVEFFVSVSLNAQGQKVDGIRRFVRTYLFKEDGKWLVHDYEHFDIGQSMRGVPQ